MASKKNVSISSLGLVACGGAVGVLAREAITQLFVMFDPTTIQKTVTWTVLIATLVINMLGAFILGYLYERVTLLRLPPHRAIKLRLLLGVGFCGGFTTYSALAIDTVLLIGNNHLWQAIGYAAGTLFLGALATLTGIAVSSRSLDRAHPETRLIGDEPARGSSIGDDPSTGSQL
ncbi:CrcB family protein [Lysinibacter sp. HNR]|uniref:fluoride efflux transporter FluC n=1 Tax=Lysinibacter sp. HNR TaxID=3031408 RepID=UPI00243538F0|nr:CrcB family protein [Lysinibacter sp. HNR]WGD38559.1 CrcB family protein [Lysinibacter sp. HNR]